MRSRVHLAVPLPAKLSELTPDQLDVLQLALSGSQLEAVFNNCPLADVEIASALATLLDRGYLEITPHPEE